MPNPCLAKADRVVAVPVVPAAAVAVAADLAAEWVAVVEVASVAAAAADLDPEEEWEAVAVSAEEVAQAADEGECLLPDQPQEDHRRLRI